MTKELHKKFFATLQMPWHADDHKFGESSDQRGWKKAKAFRQGDIVVSGDYDIGPLDSTVYFADGGRCSVCRDGAVYVFRNKLYCAGCWLAWDESYD